MNHPNQPPFGHTPGQPHPPEIWRSSGDLFEEEGGDAAQHFIESNLRSEGSWPVPPPPPSIAPNFDFGPGAGQPWQASAYETGIQQPGTNAEQEQGPPLRPQQVVHEEGVEKDKIEDTGVVRGARDPAYNPGYLQQQRNFGIQGPPAANPHTHQGPRFVSHHEELGTTTAPSVLGGGQPEAAPPRPVGKPADDTEEEVSFEEHSWNDQEPPQRPYDIPIERSPYARGSDPRQKEVPGPAAERPNTRRRHEGQWGHEDTE